MEIGTIGAGDFAQAFAKRALKAGHKLRLSNSRGPESLREVVNQLGPGAKAVTKEEAAACEMVLLAVPWDNVPETLASLPTWKNQILIDATNPFHGKAGTFRPADVGNLSTSQLVAALAAGARVVKALNHMKQASALTESASALTASVHQRTYCPLNDRSRDWRDRSRDQRHRPRSAGVIAYGSASALTVRSSMA
jgi:predicted dinucleotide-binding enzyme